MISKEDIQKISSKLELIKSKCMNNKPKMSKADSKKTLNSLLMNNDELN